MDKTWIKHTFHDNKGVQGIGREKSECLEAQYRLGGMLANANNLLNYTINLINMDWIYYIF